MDAKPLIVIADDDELLRTILEHRLRRAGYEVAAAENGKTALEAIRSRAPSAIILDAMMPVVDGFEVLRRIKSDPSLAPIPVIMLSALRRENDIVDALKIGAADYLVKPFIPDELTIRLARLIQLQPAAQHSARA